MSFIVNRNKKHTIIFDVAESSRSKVALRQFILIKHII